MKFLVLLYDDEKAAGTMEQQVQAGVIKEYMEYEGWLATAHAGKKLGGEALEPSSTSTTLRIRNGKRTLTDGPFAETREALGGFYLFEANNLDEAIAMAEKVPAAKTGSVEIRPVVDFSNVPGM